MSKEEEIEFILNIIDKKDEKDNKVMRNSLGNLQKGYYKHMMDSRRYSFKEYLGNITKTFEALTLDEKEVYLFVLGLLYQKLRGII